MDRLRRFLERMKLASLREGGRDGTLVVVSRDLHRMARVPEIAPTLQRALDDWGVAQGRLRDAYDRLNETEVRGALPFESSRVASPLPRAYQWADGSAYLSHVERVRRARGAEVPASFRSDPLLYQGGSDGFLGPTSPILAASEDWGIDLEAEVAVVTDDVPMGLDARGAADHVALLMLVNDVSLRNLIPAELAKGFGFFHGKPASAFSPTAVTPDELGPAWDGARVRLPLLSFVNGRALGWPNAGVDMAFGFPELIAHAAKTRSLAAGTIIGSGTVSNEDRSVGVSCLAERRTIEIIETGEPRTPFLRFGDRVRIEMLDATGRSIFGAIEQVVARYEPGAGVTGSPTRGP
jgi:fumarylacetoacetate (FAA) hydrolase